MVRQPYSVAVLSTRGRLHPLVPEGEKTEMRGGAFFNGKEGRDDFRKTAPEGGYIPNPYGRDLGLGYRVRTPSSQEGDRGVEKIQ